MTRRDSYLKNNLNKCKSALHIILDMKCACRVLLLCKAKTCFMNSPSGSKLSAFEIKALISYASKQMKAIWVFTTGIDYVELQ